MLSKTLETFLPFCFQNPRKPQAPKPEIFESSSTVSFISQLSDECNMCKDFIDRNAVKTLRFESDLSTTHQILGPLFKDAVPLSITNLFKYHCLTPLLQGFDWSKWCLTKPLGAWPSTNATWAAWVKRMKRFFGKE
ncbi:hypothetical protein ACFX19_022320 [Malus domestica]